MASEEEKSPLLATEEEKHSPMMKTDEETSPILAAEDEKSPVPAIEENKPTLAAKEENPQSPAPEEKNPAIPAFKLESFPMAATTTEEEDDPVIAAVKIESLLMALRTEEEEEDDPEIAAVKLESLLMAGRTEEKEEEYETATGEKEEDDDDDDAREQKRRRAWSERNFPWASVQCCKARLTSTPPKCELEFKIYDPCEGKTREACFDLPESSMFLYYNESAQYLSTVHASKNGWVLVEEESPVGARSIVLFNPFTGQDFPAPESFDNHRIAAATMTAGPDSSDCILFAVFRCEKKGTNYLGSCRYADDLWSWGVLMIPDSDAEFRTVKSMVYCAGEAMLYFVYEDGKLWRFDYLDQFFTAIDETEFAFPIDSLNLVEYEGRILLATRVILDKTNVATPEERYRWIVSRFDRDFLSWVRDGLDSMTLFLSASSFCVPASDTIAVGNISGCVCSFSGRFPRVYPVQREQSWKEARWYVSLLTFYGCASGGAAGDLDQQSFWIEAPILEEDN